MQVLNAAKEEYATATDAPAREKLHAKYALQVRDLARRQGGVYVKAAQFVASLQGGAGEAIVPRPFVEALSELTDNASPQPLAVIAPVIHEELAELSSKLVTELAEGADDQPVGAASLAQVHRARLRDGRQVALKVQYPWLRAQLADDFGVFRMMSSMVQPAGYDLSWLVQVYLSAV